jgi:hypothetical protein
MILVAVWKSGAPEVVLQAPEFHRSVALRLDGVVAELSNARDSAESDLVSAGKTAQSSSIAAIESELGALRQERTELIAMERSTTRALISAVTLNTDAILEDRKRDLRLAFVDKKITGLERALTAATDYKRSVREARMTAQAAARSAQVRLFDLRGAEAGAKAAWLRAGAECLRSTGAIKRLKQQNPIRREWNIRIRGERDRLAKIQKSDCENVADLRSALQAATNRRVWQEKQRAASASTVVRAQAWIENDLPVAVRDLSERAEQERQNARRSLAAKAERFWDRYEVNGIIEHAAKWMAALIATPFLIRLLCYFVLAPAAMRRPAIRLRMPGGMGTDIPPAERSTTSVAVRLSAGEELLVRQDYLQTTSHVGAKGTQWFLDWRVPLTSFASGLTFLTRIRGEGETTTVSAVRDPFAEVAVVTLPDGSSCVLHPRALAAVVQPTKRRLRVNTQWRLNSMNAWLTMQLRYVVFHGPARLIIKGGRGIRVERAEQGRIFGQDQLVGFSADLAYSVTRTETFWPYFLGRESLLKDRVEAGDGVLVIEEAPMASRHGTGVRRGIEDIIDGGLKVIGV